MAELVANIALSHAPGLTGWLDQAPEDEAQRLVAGYEELGRLFRATKPDVVIGLANDHCLNMPVDGVHDFCVGTAARWQGPADWFADWLNVPPYRVDGDAAVAAILRDRLRGADFDTDEATDLLFDDNWSVPLLFLTPDYDVPLVPIHMNCIVPPLISPEKCYAAGQLLGQVIRQDLPADMRVALMGTGGLSHDPGGPKYFEVDEDFDRWFLGLLEAGDWDTVLREVTVERMAAAGDGGTTELLSWLIPMGAAGSTAATTVCYEPSVALRCGMGAVHWQMEMSQ